MHLPRAPGYPTGGPGLLIFRLSCTRVEWLEWIFRSVLQRNDHVAMVFPFGVGFVDFVDAIQLVRTVAKALAESSGAGSQYRGVIAALNSLEAALEQVKATENLPAAQAAALQQAASRCEETFEHFLTKIKKYEPSLKLGGSLKKWKDALRKVQWTLNTKDELTRFQAEIQGHAMAIQILLTAAHMYEILPCRSLSSSP